jgi:hypothetical protein
MEFACDFGVPPRRLRCDTDAEVGLISAQLLDSRGGLVASRLLDLEETPLIAKVMAVCVADVPDEAIAELLPALFPGPGAAGPGGRNQR